MGCGRVGAQLAGELDERGHSVAVIDVDPEAFRRLPPGFSGRRITGVGFDRDALRQARIQDAYAFAAVSNGDNSNIIAARVVRETFGIQRVVARIYDTSRAVVYERLGIPTVAPVRRTAEAVMSWLMPPDASLLWTNATGDVSIVAARPVSAWYGVPFRRVEALAHARVAFVSRLGIVEAAREDMVVQEHDVLMFAIDGKDPVPLRDLLTEAPKAEE